VLSYSDFDQTFFGLIYQQIWSISNIFNIFRFFQKSEKIPDNKKIKNKYIFWAILEIKIHPSRRMRAGDEKQKS